MLKSVEKHFLLVILDPDLQLELFAWVSLRRYVRLVGRGVLVARHLDEFAD